MVVSEFVQSIRPLMAKFGVDAPDIRIHGMTLDSRDVSPHTAFVAVKGHQLDGREFIPQAISLGSPVIFCQVDEKAEHGQVSMRGKTLLISLFDLPATLSSLAGAFYDYPANKLITTAVTGTNGKTSTVNLISQCKRLLGTRAGAVGTLGSGIFDGEHTQWTESKTANTTPDAIQMQFLMAEFVQHGVGHVAFEASSHALVQQRLSQVKTDVAVFTNLSRDHLDYHGTMENYAAAKRLLLDQPSLKAAVVNVNDPWSADWLKGITDRKLKGVVTGIDVDIATISPELRHCIALDIQYHKDGCTFLLKSSWGEHLVNSALLGEFNVHNVLSAIAVLLVQGERFEDVVNVVPHLTPVAGRMEVFHFSDYANVVVDYAHTPDALDKALSAMSRHTQAKRWCVFGCGGDRDKGKRPEMAKIAESLSDCVVLTTDNARSEEPLDIENDIRKGFVDESKVISRPDRKDAIRYCLENADKDDLILVAGKGHETYQIIKNKTIDYDERAFVASLQQELKQ